MSWKQKDIFQGPRGHLDRQPSLGAGEGTHMPNLPKPPLWGGVDVSEGTGVRDSPGPLVMLKRLAHVTPSRATSTFIPQDPTRGSGGWEWAQCYESFAEDLMCILCGVAGWS